MKKVLEQLYNGELYPYSKFQTIIEEYQENRNKAFRSYSIFIEKLPDNLKKEFQELIDAHIGLMPYEMEQNFIDGFRIGVRMMTEVFITPTDNEEHA